MSKYLYHSSSDLHSTLKRDYIRQSELVIDVLTDVVIVPYPNENIKSDIEKKSGKLLEGEFVMCCCDAYVDFEKEITENVVFIGEFSTRHYGNFLIDYLCRLYCRDITQKFIYVSNRLCIEEIPLYMNILQHLQIRKDQLVRITHPTCCTKVLVPEKSMIHDYYITSAYAQIYEDIWQSVEQRNNVDTINKYEKIYLTRQQLKKHKEVGEKVFERFFELNGFQIIAPEQLSFIEQVVVFRHAKEIASIEGTHAHNIIFKGTSRNTYKQIILRKQSEIIPRQVQLNQITGGETVWIDIFSEPFNGFPISHDRGPFLLKWNKQIEKYARDNHMTLPVFRRIYAPLNIIEYICKCMGYWLKHNIKRVYFKIRSK